MGDNFGGAMVGWRFVEQERLRVGDALPEGCALVPPGEIRVGEMLHHTVRGIVQVFELVCGEFYANTSEGSGLYVDNHRLFRVVEPIPAAPQKLGRLPKVGEKFWVEMECDAVDCSKAPVKVSKGLCGYIWLDESFLGINNVAKRAELAAARARVAELERELGGGE